MSALAGVRAGDAGPVDTGAVQRGPAEAGGGQPPLLEASGLKMVYGGRTVLAVQRLAVRPREFIAVVGPSGAGKSTLLRLLALVEKPAAGELWLFGRKVWGGGTRAGEKELLQLRRRLALVLQTPVPFRTSVWGNLARVLGWHGQAPGAPESRRRIRQALQAVGLADKAQQAAASLSGGEAQRLAVARALVLQPQLALLDEPTANLDPGNVALVEAGVRSLWLGLGRGRGQGLDLHQGGEQELRPNPCGDPGGATVIMVTHNLFQARRLATRVLFFWDGQLVEDQPVDQFFTAARDPRTQAFLQGKAVF